MQRTWKKTPKKSAHILAKKIIDKKAKKLTVRKTLSRYETALQRTKEIIADVKKKQKEKSKEKASKAA